LKELFLKVKGQLPLIRKAFKFWIGPGKGGWLTRNPVGEGFRNWEPLGPIILLFLGIRVSQGLQIPEGFPRFFTTWHYPFKGLFGPFF